MPGEHGWAANITPQAVRLYILRLQHLNNYMYTIFPAWSLLKSFILPGICTAGQFGFLPSHPGKINLEKYCYKIYCLVLVQTSVHNGQSLLLGPPQIYDGPAKNNNWLSVIGLATNFALY